MYSVVLVAALTAGSTSNGHWFSHGCTGCHGCHGWSGSPGGHGWGYASYTGNLCHGCFGGSACYGGYGLSHQNVISIYAPAVCVGTFGCTGCYGCYGGWSCYGAALPHHGYWNECPQGAVAPESDKAAPKFEETPQPRELRKEPAKQTKARVNIDAPVEAKVYIDGKLMKATARAFQTPNLEAGETYFYEIRVELERAGQTLVETQRVLLHPGQTVTAAFPNLNQTATTTARTDR